MNKKDHVFQYGMEAPVGATIRRKASSKKEALAAIKDSLTYSERDVYTTREDDTIYIDFDCKDAKVTLVIRLDRLDNYDDYGAITHDDNRRA